MSEAESVNTESTETVSQETTTEAQGEQVETQSDTTNQMADTTESKPKSNGSELGLEKKVEEENVDSSEMDISALDSLVEMALNNELNEEQIKMLEDAGMSKHFDMIVEGHRAKIAANDKAIFDTVGGKEQYQELQGWAASNLSDKEIETFNKAVLQSGDIELAKLAVEGLHARFAREKGLSPSKRVESGSTTNTSTEKFSSVDDYINEARSFKYKSDPEYAAQVEARRAKSGF